MQQSSVLSLSSSKPILSQAQVSGIPPGSPPKSSQTPPWSSHSISVTSTKSTQLPPAFDAYQKLESAPNQRCMVIHSSEGSSARKRLIVNVNCQSHSILQGQSKADLHNWRYADQNRPRSRLSNSKARPCPRATQPLPFPKYPLNKEPIIHPKAALAQEAFL